VNMIIKPMYQLNAPVLAAARVYGHSPAAIVGSNKKIPLGVWMFVFCVCVCVCVCVCLCCQVEVCAAD
jgi:4'-phosphopantetheinyl transferase